MKFIINGKEKLKGEITVAGAKNLALKALAASFLFKQEIVINNIPDIEDIKQMLEIIKDLGAKVEKINNYQYKISTQNISKTTLSPILAPKLRASIV